MEIVVYILLGVAAVVLGLLAVVLCRTLAFRPKKAASPSPKDTDFDGDAVIERLRTLVRYPTVSYTEKEKEDEEAFRGLISALPTLYHEREGSPGAHRTAYRLFGFFPSPAKNCRSVTPHPILRRLDDRCAVGLSGRMKKCLFGSNSV